MERPAHPVSPSTRSAALRSLVWGCVLAAGASSAQEAGGDTCAARIVEWEYRVDAAVTPPVDAGGWQPLSKDSWRTLPRDTGRAWLRVALPERSCPDAALLIEKHFVSAEVWLEGQASPLTLRPVRHDSTLWRLIHLPADPKGGHVFIRVGVPGLRLAANGGPISIGRRTDLVVSLVGKSVANGVIALTSLVVGLAALLVYLRRREQRAYLYFALFALGEGLILFANTDLRQLVGGDHAAWTSLRLAGRALAPPMLVAYVAEVLAAWPRLRLARWGSVAAGISVALVALDLFAHPVVHRPMLYWLTTEIAVCMTMALAVVVRTAWRGDRGSWLLLTALLLTAVVSVHERLLQLGYIPGSTLTGWSHLVLLVAIGDRLLREFTGVYAELQREVRRRDEFLSIASHELRNPLAVIAADAALLDGQDCGPERAQRVDAIRRQVKHLTRLTDDLLDVARLQRGTLALKVEPLSLTAAVETALCSMKHAAAAARVELRFERGAEAVWVRADSTRLDQMICNVVRNAIQHTEAGGQVIVALASNGARAEVRISDTGEGMSKETMARLFRLFQRGDGSSLQRGEGMGVGLALVKQLAELHGGTVSARSEGLGRGSAFVLELPACGPPANLEASTPAEPVPVPAAGPGRQRSVLLVDDNANLRRSMRLLLEQSGFAVSEAQDGQEGLAQLLTGAFDSAVVDLRMPVLDGLEVARRVRASAAAAELRLIALTGFGRPEDKETARQAGFDEVLVKPADPEHLAQLLGAPRGSVPA